VWVLRREKGLGEPTGNRRKQKEGVIRRMAKEAPTAKKTAKKVVKPEKPAAKPAAKPTKPAQKATKPSAKTAQAAAKAAPQAAKKTPAKGVKAKAKKVTRGTQLYCDVCGLVVSVDEPCGCNACDIICCGTEMQARK
jgi:hypothetical protein